MQKRNVVWWMPASNTVLSLVGSRQLVATFGFSKEFDKKLSPKRGNKLPARPTKTRPADFTEIVSIELIYILSQGDNKFQCCMIVVHSQKSQHAKRHLHARFKLKKGEGIADATFEPSISSISKNTFQTY